jgi:hypothetical protein
MGFGTTRLGFIQIVSVRSVVNRFGVDQGVFFTTDREWMGSGWDLRQPLRRSGILSRSYPCDPWLNVLIDKQKRNIKIDE